MIEYNTSDGCNSGPNGNVPIWWENGDYTVAQYNEVFGSGASESKEDSQAFDADVNATLNYIQYNYTHDNPSGAYFICSLGSKYTTHIRNNISQNDGYGTNSYGGGAIVTMGGWSSAPENKLYVYNNDFYLSKGHDSYITNNWDGETVNPDNFKFINNVIYSDATSKGWHPYLQGSVSNNAYGGSDKNILREDDDGAVTISAADFNAIGNGGSGIDSVNGYRLTENSVCREAGIIVPGNGGLDYWGNAVSAIDVPNIGADNSGAKITQPEGYINFADRPNEDAALTGAFKSLDFKENWRTKSVAGKKVLYLSGSTTGKITLPEKKALSSFSASCDGTAKVTLSTDSGYQKTFCLTSTRNTFETEFSASFKELTVTVEEPGRGSHVVFDGLTLKDAAQEAVNLAINKPVTTSGIDQFPGSNGNDGDDDSMWVHMGDELDQWWCVDLGADYDLSKFALVFEKDEAEGAWGYQIEAKNSTQEDFDLLPIYDATENEDGARIQQGSFAPGSVYRYVRVKLTKFPGYDYPLPE